MLKLVARRPKDLADLAELLALTGLDWEYVEQNARDWDAEALLQALRSPF